MPKYRYRILTGVIAELMDRDIRTVCEWKDVEVLELNVQLDHIHAVFSIPPKISVSAFAHRFQDLFTTHDASGLAAWLGQADQSELRSFARVVARDRDAVLAALCFRWSTGPVEGHINRLKLIKRQGYGRTGFALLRQRVRRAG